MCTQPLTTYEQYYNLENYLFDEVRPRFKNTKLLSPFDFFAIAIWKSNRNKTRLRDGFLDEGRLEKSSLKIICKTLASFERGARPDEVVESLRKVWGMGIPVASAYLTVLYPEDFTIVDERAIFAFTHHPSLTGYYGINKPQDQLQPNPITTVNGYLRYVEVCKMARQDLEISTLREFDKLIWGYSFHEDLREFVKDIPEIS